MISSRDFAKVIAVLNSGMGRPFTPQQIEVWYDLLKDLRLEVLQRAAARWLTENETGFPSIAILRRFASEATNGVVPSAAVVWEKVRYCLRIHGRCDYEPEKLPKVRAYIGEMGWLALGGSGGYMDCCDSENVSIQAGQFRKAYESLAERESKMRCLPEELRPRVAGEVSKTIEGVARHLGNIPEEE